MRRCWTGPQGKQQGKVTHGPLQGNDESPWRKLALLFGSVGSCRGVDVSLQILRDQGHDVAWASEMETCQDMIDRRVRAILEK